MCVCSNRITIISIFRFCLKDLNTKSGNYRPTWPLPVFQLFCAHCFSTILGANDGFLEDRSERVRRKRLEAQYLLLTVSGFEESKIMLILPDVGKQLLFTFSVAL